MADRSEHSSRIILPSLEAGKNVICERWNSSTLAYQNAPTAQSLIDLCNFPKPDVEIYLDISPEEAMKRIRQRGKIPDNFEVKGLPYLREVSSRYRQISQSQRMISVKCDGLTEDETFTEIAQGLGEKLCQSR